MYITTHVSTVFPIAATVPSDYKFRHAHTKAASKKPEVTFVARPEFPTELDVTRAIADGSFRGFATTAYILAKRYQAYLKAIAPHPFHRAAAKNQTVGLNFRAGYTF